MQINPSLAPIDSPNSIDLTPLLYISGDISTLYDTLLQQPKAGKGLKPNDSSSTQELPRTRAKLPFLLPQPPANTLDPQNQERAFQTHTISSQFLSLCGILTFFLLYSCPRLKYSSINQCLPFKTNF